MSVGVRVWAVGLGAFFVPWDGIVTSRVSVGYVYIVRAIPT